MLKNNVPVGSNTYAIARYSGFFSWCTGTNSQTWILFEDLTNATWKSKYLRLDWGKYRYRWLIQRYNRCTYGYLYNYNIGAWEAKTAAYCGTSLYGDAGWTGYENYRTMYPMYPDCPEMGIRDQIGLTVGGPNFWNVVSPTSGDVYSEFNAGECFTRPYPPNTPIPGWRDYPYQWYYGGWEVWEGVTPTLTPIP
jgi:hypothetical protein